MWYLLISEVRGRRQLRQDDKIDHVVRLLAFGSTSFEGKRGCISSNVFLSAFVSEHLFGSHLWNSWFALIWEHRRDRNPRSPCHSTRPCEDPDDMAVIKHLSTIRPTLTRGSSLLGAASPVFFRWHVPIVISWMDWMDSQNDSNEIFGTHSQDPEASHFAQSLFLGKIETGHTMTHYIFEGQTETGVSTVDFSLAHSLNFGMYHPRLSGLRRCREAGVTIEEEDEVQPAKTKVIWKLGWCFRQQWRLSSKWTQGQGISEQTIFQSENQWFSISFC